MCNDTGKLSTARSVGVSYHERCSMSYPERLYNQLRLHSMVRRGFVIGWIDVAWAWKLR